MSAVLQTIRILVTIQIINNVGCQDGFSEQDLLRLQQQLASNDGQVETITSYSTNIIQRDPNAQSISSVSVRYHMSDPDKQNDAYNRADRARSRKVYRIKNPFQRPEENEERQQDNTSETQDSGTSASNQYAAMQYSLPPDEFLQQMRERENQFYQQQQLSTQASGLGYTATPQPQYQYSTIAPTYESQQPSQIPQLEPKMSQGSTYLTNTNYQYNGANLFGLDGIQSTPSPMSQFLSTVIPNTQFVGTPANSYVSSSSPLYLSSPSNYQQYVSSPISTVGVGTSDYNNNRVTTTIGSQSYNYDNNNDITKKMQIDHYDNSANGIRYPISVQQYQHEYPSSTPAPSSSPYSEPGRDSWQNSIGTNSMQKSIQDYANQYRNFAYNNQDSRSETNSDNSNSDTHRIGNTMQSTNNVFFNVAQSGYQMSNNAKSRTRDADQETAQPTYYSHGDYGWKLSDKKSGLSNQDNYPSGNYPRYQTFQQPQGYSNSDGASVSQMNFQMDVGRTGYNQISKSSPETLDPQEFAKAAAKAQEKQQQDLQLQSQQQQLYGNNYPSSYNNYIGTVAPGAYNDKQRNKYSENTNSYPYNNLQNELITAAPYYYSNSKENYDSKLKLPFDHDKALKNIVPIDVSNVVSDSQTKGVSGLDTNKYNIQNIGKDQKDQGLNQYYRSITDAYYKDKNAIYGFNIKSKPEEYLPGDTIKQGDSTSPYYTKLHNQESLYSQDQNDNKRFLDGSSQAANHMSQFNNYQDNTQASANIHSLQRPANQLSDLTNILKLNDIPHRLTQGLSADSLRLNNFDQSSLPTQLPVRINQNVGSHQIDVANSILNKYMLNKQANLNLRPELDPQAGSLMSTINGFKVANPFNVDLKLVADMLKGKSPVDESHLLGLRDQLNKPLPLKFDISQLQQLLLKTENPGYAGLGDGITGLGSPFLEIYGPGRYPYQGIKYSRSQEEEEGGIVPIADASNTHPIGAVIEEGDIANVREASTGTELTAQEDESMTNTFVEDRPKNSYKPRPERLRHPNGLIPGRNSYPRKHPKSDIDEPYPLLKPPPPQSSRTRKSRNKYEKQGRRRRVPKPKVMRLINSEPLFEAGTDLEDEEPLLQTVLRPPSLTAESKADVDVDELETSLDS